MAWQWELDAFFNHTILPVAQSLLQSVRSVDWRGNPSGASMGVTTNSKERIQKVTQGDALGSVSELQFRDPDHFCAGELLN